MVRRLAAIMFTDVVGYSALAQADEAAALKALEGHNQVLRPVFARHRGREVKTVGDAFVVVFDSALDAVNCAVEAQRSLRQDLPMPRGNARVQIRIGVHVGDVEEAGSDILGDAVNIASRVVELAEPDGVCVTQQVYDQVNNKTPVGFTKLPPARLKNIKNPVTLYQAVLARAIPAAVAPAPLERAGHQLAVLPLSNISPDPNDGYFADGLTEELTSALSQVRGLSVIARSSVEAYRGVPKAIGQVGVELGADTVLEGSVRKSGNRIRISLQLIDVATQRHVWSNSFNREIDDVFSVQMEIAEHTAKALRLKLARSAFPKATRRPVPNPKWGVVTTGAAYEHYLRGLVASVNLGEKGPAEAIRSFERATALEPRFADAYAAWSNLLVRAAGDSVAMREAIPKARALAEQALRLEPDNSAAHAALGNIALQYDNDWEVSEAEFEKAIELNPSNVTAYSFYALLLMTLGRYDEAKEIYRRAILLDPGGHHQGGLGWAEVESGNLEEGIRLMEEAESHHGTSAGHRIGLGFLYLRVGRRADALRMADLRPTSGVEDEEFDHALLSALVGRPAAARKLAQSTERGETTSYTSATHLAMLYSALGEKRRALDLLEKDHREGDRVLWLFYRGVFFDPIRHDPRFAALLQELRLPSYSFPAGLASNN
jgi:adenylate cyclase